MNKILIVEDDKNIQDIIAFNLEKSNYQVFTTDSGLAALSLLKDEDDISLILMDVMMPDMNGFDCTKAIRTFSSVPIIMLTALEDESNILHGFDCGVNDYVTKPFSVREVVARVTANIRSFSALKLVSPSAPVLHINNIELNTLTNSVQICGLTHDLTLTEYNLLLFFYHNPNIVFDRKTLLSLVWGYDFADLRTVDVTIRRLRKKIELVDSDPQNIKTKRGKGYYLCLS